LTKPLRARANLVGAAAQRKVALLELLALTGEATDGLAAGADGADGSEIYKPMMVNSG
jgi:outer membrane protein TolC